MQTNVHTISGYVGLGWPRGRWFAYERHPDAGDLWRRRWLRLGPLYLSWSIAIDG